MKLKRKTKLPKTELENIKAGFLDYDTTKLSAEYTIDGKLIKIETDDPALITYLKSNNIMVNE